MKTGRDNKMKGLIICEESQEVTKAFRAKGHEFFSNDMVECSGGKPEWHIVDDCFHYLSRCYIGLDFLGGHPPCTYLANSGVRWLYNPDGSKNQERWIKMKLAAMFFKCVLDNVKSIGKGYVENPIMHKHAIELIGERPTQVIQPWQFGHTETKATCLWIVGLPPLKETNNVKEEMMKLPYKDRAKIHYASPGKDRQKLRSKTYSGIAKAIADQWS